MPKLIVGNLCPQKARGSRQKAVDTLSKKFLRNFDPEHSEREKRKLYRRLYQGHRRHLYDDKGIYMQTAHDLCDCLNLECVGCHYPCPKCSSPKCGHECRYISLRIIMSHGRLACIHSALIIYCVELLLPNLLLCQKQS